MKKLTIAEASQEIGISKEAIHNRIRRGSLNCIIEDGIKYVMYDATITKQATRRTPAKKQVVDNNDKYYQLLEVQNQKLQEKLEKLELETSLLREQKEQLLIAEKDKIEEIYLKKDEQLKSILSAINTTAMINAPQKEVHDIEIVDIEEKVEKKPLISLKKHLKNLKISKEKRLKIKAKFNKKAKKDKRIITKGDKFYIELSKYDYSDLIDKYLI